MADARGVQRSTYVARAVVVIAVAAAVMSGHAMDEFVRRVWSWCLTSSVFTNQYFEAFWPPLIYPVFTGFWLGVDRFGGSYAGRYKIQPHGKRKHAAVESGTQALIGAVTYLTPVIVIEAMKCPRIDRLPAEPPTFWGLVGGVISSMLVFDTLFFFIHWAFHRNRWLMRNVHYQHHRDPVSVATEANWVHWAERLSLVLSAAAALKVTQAHQLVRTLYTAYAVYFLIENHCGYDHPLMLANIVPFGLVSGSRQHDAHHQYGNVCYAEYFTHWDWIVEKLGLERGYDDVVSHKRSSPPVVDSDSTDADSDSSGRGSGRGLGGGRSLGGGRRRRATLTDPN